MNGKIRVSIVATALNGSESKPYLNLVNNSNGPNNNRLHSQGDNLFNTNFIEKNISNSIDGATALKLDESYEIKNKEEQTALIDNFEDKEEKKINNEEFINMNFNNDIPSGVSIESASYMESNSNIVHSTTPQQKNQIHNINEEEQVPKFFQMIKFTRMRKEKNQKKMIILKNYLIRTLMKMRILKFLLS